MSKITNLEFDERELQDLEFAITDAIYYARKECEINPDKTNHFYIERLLKLGERISYIKAYNNAPECHHK